MMDSTVPYRRLWLAAALLLAVVVRVTLLAEKPFWRDEAGGASLVLAPLAESYARPRTVPVGFIALTKLTQPLPLPAEVSFRLLPLAAGLAIVWLIGTLARALGAGGAVALGAVWLAAGTPALVYYSREMKAYGLDALAVIVVPLLGLWLFERGAARPALAPRAAGALLVAGLAVAPWVTFGAAFPIAVTLAWGWAVWWWRGAAPARRWWLAASAVYALSFAAVYRFILAAQSTNPSLRAFWRTRRFVDTPTPPLELAWEATARYARVLFEFVFHELWWAALPLVLLGVLAWPRRSRPLLLWLALGCAAATVAAALADRYLIAEGRLLLYGVPPLLLAAAAGLTALGGRLWPARGATLAVAVAALVSIGWSALAIAHRLPPHHNRPKLYFRYDILHDIEPLIAAVERHAAPGEPIYVAQYSSRPFVFYRRGRLPGATICMEPCNPYDSAQAWGRQLDRRGWAIITDDESGLVVRELRKLGLTLTTVATARGMVLWEVEPAPPA